MTRRVTAARYVGAALLCTALVGCGLYDGPDAAIGPAAQHAELAESAPADPSWSVPEPGPLKGKPLRADVLVVGADPLPERLRAKVRATPGVRDIATLSVASVALGERTITVGAVDPTSYRRFTHSATAKSDPVWRSVAAGEAVITHQIGRDLSQALGRTLALRNASDEVAMRIGAYATTVAQIDAVVNHRRAEQLGMKAENALVVSLRGAQRAVTVDAIEKVVGDRAQVAALTERAPTSGTRQAAYLTGGSVAAAVGSFHYQYFEDGSVQPDGRWVSASIRTETVPILGRVTCHQVMLRQLRAALSEIEQRGLADKIDVSDYGGCYAPRFIGRDPSRGLSLHTWGIAVDLNVATNQRGTVGQIDHEVVSVFKRWGFAWGGDWQWTDPMHFELAALVR